jgi:hypothetical protein
MADAQVMVGGEGPPAHGGLRGGARSPPLTGARGRPTKIGILVGPQSEDGGRNESGPGAIEVS